MITQANWITSKLKKATKEATTVLQQHAIITFLDVQQYHVRCWLWDGLGLIESCGRK